MWEEYPSEVARPLAEWHGCTPRSMSSASVPRGPAGPGPLLYELRQAHVAQRPRGGASPAPRGPACQPGPLSGGQQHQGQLSSISALEGMEGSGVGSGLHRDSDQKRPVRSCTHRRGAGKGALMVSEEVVSGPRAGGSVFILPILRGTRQCRKILQHG